MTPGGDGGSYPVGCFDVGHEGCGVDQFFVGFYGDEVGVSPMEIRERVGVRVERKEGYTSHTINQ